MLQSRMERKYFGLVTVVYSVLVASMFCLHCDRIFLQHKHPVSLSLIISLAFEAGFLNFTSI